MEWNVWGGAEGGGFVALFGLTGGGGLLSLM